MALVADKDKRKKRVTICEVCPHKVKCKLGAKCDKCGCLIKTKIVYDRSSCPIQKW